MGGWVAGVGRRDARKNVSAATGRPREARRGTTRARASPVPGAARPRSPHEPREQRADPGHPRSGMIGRNPHPGHPPARSRRVCPASAPDAPESDVPTKERAARNSRVRRRLTPCHTLRTDGGVGPNAWGGRGRPTGRSEERIGCARPPPGGRRGTPALHAESSGGGPAMLTQNQRHRRADPGHPWSRMTGRNAHPGHPPAGQAGGPTAARVDSAARPTPRRSPR